MWHKLGQHPSHSRVVRALRPGGHDRRNEDVVMNGYAGEACSR